MKPAARESPDEAGPAAAVGMVWIPGGEFVMGSDDFYPEESPTRRVFVDGFWMDIDRAGSPGRTCASTASRGRHRSARSPPTVTGSVT